MPYQITWEKQGVCCRLEGDITLQEFIEHIEKIYDDQRAYSIVYYIWDATNVKSVCMSDIDIEIQAVKGIGRSIHKEEIHGAYVATEKRVREQIQRYINRGESLLPTWKFALFESVDEARKWIPA